MARNETIHHNHVFIVLPLEDYRLYFMPYIFLARLLVYKQPRRNCDRAPQVTT